MIIVSATDESFVPHFAVTLHSAWSHNRDAEFVLLDCGIAPESGEALETFAEQIGARLFILRIDTDRFLDLPTSSAWSVAVYARLLLGELLPHDCATALYLDADCIVTSNLSELWATDLTNSFVAGVMDCSALRNEHQHSGLTGLSGYINAGVMLLNLDAWRADRFGAKVLAAVRENEFLYGEQTGINLQAAGRVVFLSETWNFMLHRCDETDLVRVRPSIIHCTGFRKPWMYRDAPFVSVYLHHRNASPFKTSPPNRFYPSNLHFAANLLLLRRKYWRRVAVARFYDQFFSQSYLASMAD